jgi:hypothetical protein
MESRIEEFLEGVQPLDLLVFQGAEGVSNVIRKLEESKLGSGVISHVEVCITQEWCPSIALAGGDLDPTRKLSWGSTLSGKLNDHVLDAETGGVTFGVQIRDLRELVERYAEVHSSTGKGNIGYARLRRNPTRIEDHEVRSHLLKEIEKAYTTYNHRQYDFNPINLLAGLYPKLRGLRKISNAITQHIDRHAPWLFCSEFAAALYADLGIIAKSTTTGEDINPEDVVPVDFLGYDEDGLKGVCHEVRWLYPVPS